MLFFLLLYLQPGEKVCHVTDEELFYFQMDSYYERKRLYRQLIAEKMEECEELIKRAKRDFNEQPINQRFLEDQIQLKKRFLTEFNHGQIISVVKTLKEKKLISKNTSHYILIQADSNITE